MDERAVIVPVRAKEGLLTPKSTETIGKKMLKTMLTIPIVKAMIKTQQNKMMPSLKLRAFFSIIF